MGLKFTKYLKILFLFVAIFWFSISRSQSCSIVKFRTIPDSLNQKKNDTVICKGSCLDLFAKIPDLKAATSYTITSIPFLDSLPCEGLGTIPSNYMYPDNLYSDKINLGFSFCFFGNSYSKCMLSDNGYISFDTSRATNPCGYNLVSYLPIPNPSNSDFLNVIMGCCMDVFVPLNGSITVQTIGAAPFRVFIVKFNHCAYNGGTCNYPANELDMKIALYETTNIIDVYIKKKTMCSGWNGGLAIQGVQDQNGTFAYATSGRNNSQWSTLNDARRYSPSGVNRNYSLRWFSGSSIIGSGLTQTVCPTFSQWYRAQLSVDSSCGSPSALVVATDSVYVNVKGTSTTINQNVIIDTIRCASNYMLLDGGTGAISYRWNNGARTRFLKVTRTGSFICQRMTDTTNCYFDSLFFNIYSEKVFIDSTSAYGCFAQGQGHLKVLGSGGQGNIQYKFANNSYSNVNIFDNLYYGSYHVKVKDAVGCEFDSLITIQRPTINVIKRNVCGVDSIGAIVMQVSNFNGPYQFKMDTGSYKTDTVFLNVKGGTHTISIKNSTGCVYDTTFSAPFTSLKLSVGFTVVKASGCTGGNPDGSNTVNASGGNPPYRYSKNFGGFSNNPTFGGLNEGNYWISIRDTFNCGIDSSVRVNALAHLYVNGYVVNASCYNTNTASIIINGFGGVSPYTFSFGGSAFSSVNTRTGLGAGTMTVSIKDGRGCVVDTVLPIGQPPPIQFGPNLTHLLCNGSNTGVIKINGFGGIPPYLFSINGGALSTNNTFSSLAAGVYTLRIRDYNQCIKDTTVTLTQPFPVNFNINKLNTTCWNSSDGKFTLTPFGGTLPYLFSYNGGAFTSKTVFDTLPIGNYSIRIKDGNNCTRDTIITIASPPRLSASFTFKSISCFGNTNGMIKIIANGGVAPYTYSFNNGVFSTLDSFVNIAAGSYSFSIKDLRGCRIDTFGVLAQPAKLAFRVILKHALCYSDSSGEINIGAIGGMPPYKYAIGTDTFSTNGVFKKKVAGIYTLHIKDAGGCLYDTVVVLTQPTYLRMNVAVLKTVSCFNGNDGELQTNGVGGTPPYRYQLNLGSFTLSTFHYGLIAGIYKITVKDSNNCTFDTLVAVSQSPRMVSTHLITNNICYRASQGNITVRMQGGSPPYIYAIDTGVFKLDSTFGNLKSGVYLMHVKDNKNCVFDTFFSITEPPKIITNATVKNITCYNGNDGKVTIFPSGGTPPYQCSIDGVNYNTTFTFSNLVAGIYKYYIRDSKGCNYDTAVTVFQSTLMTNYFTVKNVSCFNSNDGALSVFTKGGSKPYSYSLNGAPFDTISSFSNLPIGTYTLQTRDTFNCIKDTTVTLTQPPQIYVKAIATNVTCYNAGNGTIEIAAIGGVPPFTFSLDNNAFSSISKFYGLSPNTYKVNVKDKLGCIRDTTITIIQPDSFKFNSLVQDVSCFGGSDGSLLVQVSGASSPYLYSFNGSAYNTDSVFSQLKADIYTVKIKDRNNCILVRKVIVNQPNKPSLLPAEVVRATWANDSMVLLQWKSYPKALFYKVSSKLANTTIVTDTFMYQKNPQTEIYNYQISVVDSCNFLNQKSLAHSTLLLNGNMEDSRFIHLQWNSYKSWLNGVDIYNVYRYHPENNSIENVFATRDTFIAFPVNPADSNVEFVLFVEAAELTGNNAISVSNRVYLYTEPKVWMPNAFSPNHDGINDVLLPKGVGLKNYTLIVYDRWGNLLFKSDTTIKSWDGKYQGEAVPMGTYIYELQANLYYRRESEREVFLKGSFQLMR